MNATIILPPGITTEQALAIKAANLGVVFSLPVPPGTVLPADVSRERILGWLDALELPIEAGEALLLPPPLGQFLAGLTKGALTAWRSKLTASPLQERWTIAQMQAERDSLPVPKT